MNKRLTEQKYFNAISSKVKLRIVDINRLIIIENYTKDIATLYINCIYIGWMKSQQNENEG